MSTNTGRRPAHPKPGTARLYPAELLPSLQSLLATLADIDFEHESDVESVRNSSADEWLKQTVIQKLEEHHRQRRAPYIGRLERLERRMQVLAA
jgi:hypothetical protein